MESTNKALLNGRGATALEEKPINQTTVITVEPQTVATEIIEVNHEVEDQQPNPPESSPKKGPKRLLLGVLGAGALATAAYYGYNYLQYSSTHQETDNATVAGHIHQVSTRINGTVTDVLANDNQIVKQGQLLVKLDPRDYQVKLQQSQAALEYARKQANAAESNISLASETAQASTTQAQGDISGAQAGISTALAAVNEAESGIPAAQAAVDQAESGVPAAEAAVREAESGVPSAEAQLAQADANLANAKANYDRYNSLYASGAISRQQLDAASATYQVAQAQKNGALQGIQQAKARVDQAKEGVAKAQAQVAQSKQGVASAQAKLAQAQEGVASAQAKLASAKGGVQQATAKGQQTQVNRANYEAAKSAIAQSEAALKDVELQLSYTNIVAPSDGRIGRKTVEVGQQVQPGTPLMAIVGNDYWVIANFKETQLEKMKVGQTAEIKLDSFPHKTFIGHIDSLSPASGAQFALLPPDNATGNFTKIVQRIPVKVVFDRESIKGYEDRVTAGMSAIVNVELK
jgi:membrane fusion protein (multidrug efflux system)